MIVKSFRLEVKVTSANLTDLILSRNIKSYIWIERNPTKILVALTRLILHDIQFLSIVSNWQHYSRYCGHKRALRHTHHWGYARIFIIQQQTLTVHSEAAVAVSFPMSIVRFTDVNTSILWEDITHHQWVCAAAIILITEVLAVRQHFVVAHPHHLHGEGAWRGRKERKINQSYLSMYQDGNPTQGRPDKAPHSYTHHSDS